MSKDVGGAGLGETRSPLLDLWELKCLLDTEVDMPEPAGFIESEYGGEVKAGVTGVKRYKATARMVRKGCVSGPWGEEEGQQRRLRRRGQSGRRAGTTVLLCVK